MPTPACSASPKDSEIVSLALQPPAAARSLHTPARSPSRCSLPAASETIRSSQYLHMQYLHILTTEQLIPALLRKRYGAVNTCTWTSAGIDYGAVNTCTWTSLSNAPTRVRRGASAREHKGASAPARGASASARGASDGASAREDKGDRVAAPYGYGGSNKGDEEKWQRQHEESRAEGTGMGGDNMRRAEQP